MSQSNQILTCIVDGMRPDRPPAIRGAAARALINSLDFTRSNFESQQERDVIMQVPISACYEFDYHSYDTDCSHSSPVILPGAWVPFLVRLE